ncbi:hypothetical protein MOQ_007599, partial [Trypanosoma cruzi marinkellei]
PILKCDSTQTVVSVSCIRMCSACVQRDGCGKQRGAHSRAAEANEAKNNHHNYSYFIHRTTVDVHTPPWLSAGTHSPHTPLQPRAVCASADTASSSGAHTHAELLRLPSILRRRDGAWVVVVVGASVVVVIGASGAVVVVVEGACVVVVVVVVFGVRTSGDSSSAISGGDSSLCDPFSTVLPVSASASVPVSESCLKRGPSSSCDGGGDELELVSASPLSTAHTDGWMHRASTNRAHSIRHVVIIVSVVVQWCGADLHSEGHGE